MGDLRPPYGLATALLNSSLQNSTSTVFCPLSQCSTLFPFTTMGEWLNCPSGASFLRRGLDEPLFVF